MSWLSNKVLPKINFFGARKESPSNLWEKCEACGQMIFHRELEESLRVCPNCGDHMWLSPRTRFDHLFDDGKYELIELHEAPTDPLKFRDSKRYVERLRESRAKTGDRDAVLVAVGEMGGFRVVIAAQNFAFMGGSMATAAGEAMIVASDRAIAEDATLIAISASGGMRMQEGILSLMQMPRTTIAVQRAREAGLPFIVVLTDPTTGGVTASFAMLGDIAIAEPGALIGFTGPRVIEQTIREQLPEGFQRSEYLLAHGMLDMIVHRKDLPATLIRIIDLLRSPNGSGRRRGAPSAEIDIPLVADQSEPETAHKGEHAKSQDQDAGERQDT